MINVGDFVTRRSYKHDIVFKVIEKKEKVCVLQGLDVRLIADASEEDLVLSDRRASKDDEFYEKMDKYINLDRNLYFYIPGSVLHLDGDESYLKRCMEFYEKANVKAYGKTIKESNMSAEVMKYLKNVNPDILVITGHDALIKKKIGEKNLYKNSDNFIKTVEQARKYEKSSEKLVIIAGACQSNYEELIKSGATFASSPKRINIHALDPAIIASSLSLSEKGKVVDLIELLDKTKYGKDGMGGLVSQGMMAVGYPRNEV